MILNLKWDGKNVSSRIHSLQEMPEHLSQSPTSPRIGQVGQDSYPGFWSAKLICLNHKENFTG